MEFIDIIESAIENSIIPALGVCSFYESLYTTAEPTESITQLGDALVGLYAAVISFCAAASQSLKQRNQGSIGITNVYSFELLKSRPQLIDLK